MKKRQDRVAFFCKITNDEEGRAFYTYLKKHMNKTRYHIQYVSGNGKRDGNRYNCPRKNWKEIRIYLDDNVINEREDKRRNAWDKGYTSGKRYARNVIDYAIKDMQESIKRSL